MLVKRFMFNNHPHGGNSYLAVCEQTGEAAMFDIGEVAEDLPSFLQEQNFTLKYLLLTHTHSDHVGGLQWLVERFRVPVFWNPKEEPTLHNAAEHRKWDFDPLSLMTYPVADGSTITLGTYTFTAYEIPGHTPGGTAFCTDQLAFVGDILFAGAVGGTSTPEAYATQIAGIKQKLLPLGDHIKVYSGHGPVTTIGIERLFNPFLD
jgi:glyoxylase-like metal-dependent hydrolase (beta-lactamase superfamily II)